jgi:hypothetical protein
MDPYHRRNHQKGKRKGIEEEGFKQKGEKRECKN